MNIKTIATAVFLSIGLIGAAQAGTPRGDIDNTPFPGVYAQVDNSAATRAQVQAQLGQARAAGEVAVSESDNAPFTAQAEGAVSNTQVAVENGPDFGDSDNVPFQGA
jgi:hypothetical protein